MKRSMIILTLIVVLLCFALVACTLDTLPEALNESLATEITTEENSNTTVNEEEEEKESSNTQEPDQTEDTSNSGEQASVSEGYNITFVVDEGVTVVVYPDQTLQNGEETLTAVSRDGDSGQATKTDGQVNFVLNFAEGYELDAISATEGYKNLKDLGNGAYRITKITADLTVTVTAKAASVQEATPQEEDINGLTSYTIDTVLEGATQTLNITATAGTFSADYTDGVLTLDVTATGEMEVALSGAFAGGIVITDSDASAIENDLTISLVGVSISAQQACPLYIDTDADVDISAKNGTVNTVTDNRAAASEDEVSAAVYVTSDLTLKGKGTLNVVSANNNGIHGKDDLTVKNLTLSVSCVDNALKGNDSVTVESGTLTLIARQGDGIKTSNSALSSKGVQKGTVTINGGVINVYAACDGVDAAYDVVVTDGTLNIYTDKYSEYSEEVTAVANGIYYIRTTTTAYQYSICYSNADGTCEWVNSSHYETVSVQSGRSRTTYYYYEMEQKSGYSSMAVYVYTSAQTQGQGDTYYAKSSTFTPNSSYDSLALSFYNGSMRLSWTNKTTQQMGGPGFGGMQEGNKDKGDYSTKGIKADNAITIAGGTITIQSYDDAIHANSDVVLESGATPSGNVTISGGTITVASNDDGIHADGALLIADGTITISKSYEGLEGQTVTITGGSIKVTASDDGINACATTGVGLQIDGGYLYVYAGGDGLDANSTTSYKGIVFNGGKVVVISTSGGNSCIDTERGYTYNGGDVVAMCPTGMQQESYNCQSSAKKYTTMSLSGYVNIAGVAVVKMPTTISNGFIICLGTSSTSFSTSTGTTYEMDANGVCWLR